MMRSSFVVRGAVSPLVLVVVAILVAVASGEQESSEEPPKLLECRAEQFDQVELRAHLSATVVEATALERIKYLRSTPTAAAAAHDNRGRSTVAKPYSVLFQIKRIFKYEGRLYDKSSRMIHEPSVALSIDLAATADAAMNHTYFYISAQKQPAEIDETSQQQQDDDEDDESGNLNLNSFFLVENFIPPTNNNNNNHNNKYNNESDFFDCKSTSIQMNRNYYLFIDAQDTNVALNNRRVFTYPIRIKSIGSSKRQAMREAATRRRLRRALFSSGHHHQPLTSSKLALFVKMPIFNLTARPLLADNDFLEQTLEKVLCQRCVKEPRIKLKSAYQIAFTNQTAKIECNFGGNPPPIVFWRRHTIENVHELIKDDFKFTIFNSNDDGLSTLIINDVAPQDDGYYYCMARDFVNGDLDNQVLVQDRVRLLVRRREANNNKHHDSSSTHRQQPQQQQQQQQLQFKHLRPTSQYRVSHSNRFRAGGGAANAMRERVGSRRKSSSPASVVGVAARRPAQRQRQKLIHDALSRNRQTTSIATFVKYLKQPSGETNKTNTTTTTTTTTTTNIMPKLKAITPAESSFVDEHKRTNTEYMKQVMSSTLVNRVTGKSEKAYVNCAPDENTCMNNGVCYVTNPNLYADDLFVYEQVKIKFCICEKYFEGQNCEIPLLKSIVYNRNEIPNDLRELWENLGKRNSDEK